jgi:hypothetical protein
MGGGSTLPGKGDDMAGNKKPRDSSHKWKVAGRWSLGGVVFIGGVSLIGLIIAWSSHPRSDSLRYEFAKTCMQVLAVAFFGTLAAIAAFTFQHSRTQADNDLERKRQENDKERDERGRKDDQLRSIMGETLTIYNRVKRIRRLLAAQTGNGRYLTLAIYDEHMANLIDEQLAFEMLKRLPPFIRNEPLSPAPYVAGSERRVQDPTLENAYEDTHLADAYQGIEKYLNHVIDEYKEKRHRAG